MSLLRWDESFSVNVVEIDEQHQRLVLMINELNDAMLQGKGKDAMGRIINKLVQYTVTHFRTEEKYFDQFGYSDAERHKEEHIAFERKVGEFKEEFDRHRLGLSIEVMDFLMTWLQKHIKGSDKKYGPLFNEKGLR